MLLWLSHHPAPATVAAIVLTALLTVVIAVVSLTFSARFGTAASTVTTVCAICLCFTGGVTLIGGIEDAAATELAAAVQDKYGTQVTEVGDVRAVDRNPVTSTWVIDGEDTVCGLDASDRPPFACACDNPGTKRHGAHSRPG